MILKYKKNIDVVDNSLEMTFQRRMLALHTDGTFNALHSTAHITSEMQGI